MTMLHNNKGFTLVELMIVVIIIGVLAGVVIPSVVEAMTKAKVQSAITILRGVQSNIAVYYVTAGTIAGLDQASFASAIKCPSVFRPDANSTWAFTFDDETDGASHVVARAKNSFGIVSVGDEIWLNCRAPSSPQNFNKTGIEFDWTSRNPDVKLLFPHVFYHLPPTP